MIVLVAILLLSSCMSAMLEPRDDMRMQLEPLKLHLTEDRLHSDIQRELRDFAELERQLAHSLEMIHTRKRQLEIKRSRISA